MNFTDKEKIEFLENLTEQYYPQGDGYDVRRNKTGSWTFGYTNDYEMQHGKGENYVLPNGIVKILMEEKAKNLAIPVVGCSVWVVENLVSLIDEGTFSTKEKAEEFAKRNRDLNVIEVRVM